MRGWQCCALLLVMLYSGSVYAGCPDIDMLENGSMYKHVVGMEVNFIMFICNPGMFIKGAEKIYCENGTWSDEFPVCQSTSVCNIINAPLNGKLRFNTFDKGGNIQVSILCEKGYVLEEAYDAVIRCDRKTGRWSNIIPQCKHQSDCLSLTAPAHGSMTEFQDAMTGYTGVQFVCDPGYEINGESKLYCNGSGSWNYEPPTCEEIRGCPWFEPVNMQYTWLSEQQVVFYCDVGYTMHGKAYNRCAKGKWLEPFPICNKNKGCSRPPTADGLTINPDQPTYKDQSIVGFSCAKGRMSGDNTRYCENGRWIGMEAICQEPSCQMLKPPADGSLTTKAAGYEVSPGSVVSFTCNGNLTLFGKDTCTCNGRNSYASWSCRTPICARNISCPEVTEFANGTVKNVSWSRVPPPVVYSRIEYSCNKGFEFLGNVYRNSWQSQCQPGGKWGTVPQPCVEQPKCPKLPDLANGVITYQPQRVGASVTFKCNSGFTLLGNGRRQCYRRGAKMVWGSTSPTCLPKLVPAEKE